MKKTLVYTGLLLLVLCIGILGYTYYSLVHSPVGPMDSWIKTNECIIQKNTNDAELNDVFIATCGAQTYYIAYSAEDLTKYIGKKVHIQAVYPKNKSNTDSVQSKEQCIAGNCQSIFKDGRSFYAISIENVQAL